MTRRSPVALAALVAAVGACLVACAQVPTTGPVVEARQPEASAPAGNLYNNPPPPAIGATPEHIVSGFLDAMQATPLQTRVARKYLTSRAQATWDPQQSVITYAGLRPPSGEATVRVRLRGADRIDARGQWQGPVTPGGSRLSFPMREEKGEWRIGSAPDALVVPRTFYETAFQTAAVYYFDPSGRILVPEVVHTPTGPQLTTTLVRSLALGPRPALDGVVRTYLPPGLTVDPVVVTKGVADVTFSGGDSEPLSSLTVRHLLAQLKWTLSQDPSVQAFEVTLGGRQLTDSTGASTFRVDGGPETLDPGVSGASSLLYALRAGRLVSGQANHLTPVGGPFGTSAQGIGAFAVSLHDDQVAATTQDSLLVGAVRSGAKPTQVLTGGGLLTPAWDFADRLWEVQNDGQGGAVVLCIVRGHTREVRVKGVTGQDVRRFLVSRDGSRIVAVLRGGAKDRIVVSRLRYDAAGRPLSGTRARPIRWAAGTTARIRDIGWMSPTTIGVLDQASPAQAEVRLLDVDGSMAPVDVHPILVRGQALGLATSPAPADTTPPYAVLPGELFNLAQVDTTTQQPVPGLRHITYAG